MVLYITVNGCLMSSTDSVRSIEVSVLAKLSAASCRQYLIVLRIIFEIEQFPTEETEEFLCSHIQ